MNVTDVIGFTLKDAKAIFENNNIKDYSIKVTSSPRLKCDDYDDNYRVVSIRKASNKEFEMIICKPL
ncbi:hypothetical protein [Acetivibrio cellulolyticus]|uniref:hypothetical protein n=1 Tax=Acetivibrio cellulolyticus TaxID=35830 RepID=UPI0001E2C265|nr:hypothetical protein [Acetivibrio cellulolyticus]